MNRNLLMEKIGELQRLKACAMSINPEQWESVSEMMRWFGTGFTQEEMIGHFNLQINRLTHDLRKDWEVVA